MTANTATVPGPIHTFECSKMLTPLNPLLAPITLKVNEDPAMMQQPSLEPLSSLTRVLLQKEGMPPRVVEGLTRLQEMENASLKVHNDGEEEETLDGLDEETFNLESNFTASIAKFADLRGREKEDVVRWRKSGKAGISSGSSTAKGVRFFSKKGTVPEFVNMVKEDLEEAEKVGEHSLQIINKKKKLEMSDWTRLSAKDGEVELESRTDYLRDVYRAHWSTVRSNIWAPRPEGDKFLRLEKRNYWFHHPGDFHMGTFERAYARPSNGFKSTEDLKSCVRAGGRDPGLAERIFGSLPAHYSWTVNYLASYALLQPLDLHREVAELERLLLLVDPNFFGMRRVVKLEDPQAQQEREDRAVLKAKGEDLRTRQAELAAREEAVKAAAARLKRRQRFLEMSPRDQGWWSLSKIKAGEERCGVCEACWIAAEEENREQCLGFAYKPTAPSSPLRCMKCEHCTAKACGKCSMCKANKDGENNQGDEEIASDCIWRRHCARSCGVCTACKEREEFGGEATGKRSSCLVKGKLVVEQEIEVIEEDAVLEHLAEWVQNVEDNNCLEQPNSLKEIKAVEMATQLDTKTRGKILSKFGDNGKEEEVWKRLVEMSWMMETTSFPTEEVYMRAHYLCTICQKKSLEVCMFSKGSQGETICTVEGNYIRSKSANQIISLRRMRKAHLQHMISHTGKGTKGNLPGFGNYEEACGQQGSSKSSLNKQKAEQKSKRRLDCDLCDFFSSSKVSSAENS